MLSAEDSQDSRRSARRIHRPRHPIMNSSRASVFTTDAGNRDSQSAEARHTDAPDLLEHAATTNAPGNAPRAIPRQPRSLRRPTRNFVIQHDEQHASQRDPVARSGGQERLCTRTRREIPPVFCPGSFACVVPVTASVGVQPLRERRCLHFPRWRFDATCTRPSRRYDSRAFLTPL